MIGDSKLDYLKIIFWTTLLRSIGPVCVGYIVLTALDRRFHLAPNVFLVWTCLETIFYFGMLFYRGHYIQRPANHPILKPRAARDQLSRLCQVTTHDFEAFLRRWFYDEPLDNIKRENVKDFIRWAFFDTSLTDPKHEDEVEEYTVRYETMLGSRFGPGRSRARCIRLTIDNVNTSHRSLLWYFCIFVVDLLTHIYLCYHSYSFHRSSTLNSLSIVPPRPQAFVSSTPSPSKRLNYWLHPHTSKTERPIVFLHGIGVGLYPYMDFLRAINSGRSKEQGTIGVLAVEILSISSRLTRSVLTKDAMCEQLKLILDQHPAWNDFVLVSHSYGSVISTYILKSPVLAPHVSSVVLIDPITILLHHPDVAFNFTVRKPKKASDHLLSYFGGKDPGVAHTLSRTFFWTQNVLWRKDLDQHHATVFLAERDSIIDPEKVRSYLTDEKILDIELDVLRDKDHSNSRTKATSYSEIAGNPDSFSTNPTASLAQSNAHLNKSSAIIPPSKHKISTPSRAAGKINNINVEWCHDLNHGQIFDTCEGVQKLVACVWKEVQIT